MAFTRGNSNNSGNNNSQQPQRDNTVGGYLNINIITRDGQRKRLGGSGIALREGHPLESALLDYCREANGDPEKLKALLSRIELTFAESVKPGEKFDLGL